MKISELIGKKSRKVKIELQDVPNYDLINPIFLLYLAGDFDNMVFGIAKYPYGIFDFFKCLQIYLKYKYTSIELKNGDYRTIINTYIKYTE